MIHFTRSMLFAVNVQKISPKPLFSLVPIGYFKTTALGD